MHDDYEQTEHKDESSDRYSGHRPLYQLNLFATFAVRETDVSRHQGGPIEGSPETPRTSVL